MGVLNLIFGTEVVAGEFGSDPFDATPSRTLPSEAQMLIDLAIEEREAASRSAFASAQAAIDRAVIERRQAQAAGERAGGGSDRRVGLPDSRPPGSPERRTGVADRCIAEGLRAPRKLTPRLGLATVLRRKRVADASGAPD